MIVGERVRGRMAQLGFSQSELARRVGVAQPTIHSLITTNKIGSRYLHRIARELGTTSAYLAGETDDPDANAPPPPAEPTVQFVTMQVALPAEPALTRMFLGHLLSLEVPNADELAPELAKLLPSGLRTLKGPLRFVPSDEADAAPDAAQDQPPAPPARRRASRT